MSDSIPSSPRLPSLPVLRDRGRELSTNPPGDDDLLSLMRETRRAAANLGDLCTRLETRLMQHELAILTEEHKTNTLRAEFDRLAEYVRKNVPVAAE